MKHLLRPTYIFIVFLIYSCASIPPATATLTHEVIDEGKQMHQLNLILVHKIFDLQKEKLNLFITQQYIPKFVANFEQKLPPTLDYKTELPNILNSVIPIITKKRDSLQNLIEAERNATVNKLNNKYIVYTEASNSLQNLVNSIVKLKERQGAIVSEINKMTNSKLDLKKFETNLDSTLIKSGNGLQKITQKLTPILNKLKQ